MAEHRGLHRVAARLAVLRLHDLRYVFGATLVSSLGDGMVGVALAFAVLDLTHSATDLGLIMAVRAITMIFGALFGGVAADRFSRRTVMMTADLLRFGGQVAIGVLLATHHATVPEIMVSQVLVAAGNAFFEPASMGMIQATAGEHVQEANALKVIANSSTGMIGPALGGVLVATVGGSYALMADGLSYLLSALLLFQVSRAAHAAAARDAEASSFVTELRGGFHEVSSRTWIWATILNMAVGNLLAASWGVLGPVVCKEHYGGAPAWAGLSVAWSIGMLVGGSSLLRFRPRFPMRAGFIVCIPAMLPLVLLGVHAPIYVVGLFSVVSGIGMTMLNALWWTAMQENVPPAAISRVSSFDWAGTLAVTPIGFALVGPLSSAIGISTALIATGAGWTLLTASGLLVRDIRMLASKPSRAEPVAEPEMASA